MKLTSRYGWPRGVAAIIGVWLACPLVAPAQAPMRVQKIEIHQVGPATASETLIRSHIRVREGEAFSQTSVDDDVRSLFNTGYFANVQVRQEIGPGGVTLFYDLLSKPLLTSIKFSGNKKYSDKKLLSKMTSKVGQPLDERKLFGDQLEIKKLYEKAGYPRTAVKYTSTVDEPAGRGTVTFEITENPKLKIEKVEFVGAQGVPQKKLRKVIKTRKRWCLSWITGSGYLKEDVLEDDKDKLAEYYRNQGYIDFELKEVKLDSTGPRTLVVRFLVSEGRRYQVGAVGVKGNTLFATNDVFKQLKMNEGKIFTPVGLNKDLEAVRDLYGTKGYVDTVVLPLKTPNVEKGTMDLVYQIEEGEKSFIEKIEIRGNTKTKDKVIRRELAVAPGEVFDTVRIKLSKQRLEGLNYFEKVETRIEPTDVRNRKNLVVGVEERSTGNFMIGAGFSSVDAIVGFIELTQANFDLFKFPRFEGGGQKFRLRLSIGTERQDYQLSFIEPWFLDRKLALGVDLYHRELNFVSVNDLYDERRSGARLSLTRALGSDFFIGSVAYTIENVGIVHVDKDASPLFHEEAGMRLVSKLGVSVAYDTRNNALLPTKGQRSEIFAEVAGGPFGGDTDYYKLEGRSARYFRGFFEGHVIEVAARVGTIEAYGGSSRVPLFDRYFLGGLYSLRGFNYRDVGPHDENYEPVGGNTYWFGAFEYSIPLVEILRFAAFYDIGNVYPNSFSFNPGPGQHFYLDNWGVGLRLNIPRMGPLRLDYGIPITHDKENSGAGKFQFGVGYTREF